MSPGNYQAGSEGRKTLAAGDGYTRMRRESRQKLEKISGRREKRIPTKPAPRVLAKGSPHRV